MLSKMATSKIISCIISFIILFTLPCTVYSLQLPRRVLLRPPYNISEILDSEPNLSEFNSYLIQTGLTNTINDYWDSGITILSLTNSAMSSLLSNISFSCMSLPVPLPNRSVIQAILSLHAIPDFYDEDRLRRVENNRTISSITDFYAKTSTDPGALISKLTIVNHEGGDVEFVSAVPGSKPVKLVKEIKTISNVTHTIPYNVSILEVSSPIIVPALLVNITRVLQKKGFNAFAKLLSETTYYNYSSAIDAYYGKLRGYGGITIFAPSDDALKATNFSEIEDNYYNYKYYLYAMLELHALDFYAPIETLKNYNQSYEVRTSPTGMFALNFSSSGDVVRLHTGEVDAQITSTLFDVPQLLIYSVDKFLMPYEYPVDGPPLPLPHSPPPPPSPAPTPPTPPMSSPPPPPSTAPPAPPAPPMTSPAPTPPPAPTPTPLPSPTLTPPQPTPSTPLPPAPSPAPTSTPSNGVNGGGGRKDGCVQGNVSMLMVVLMCIVWFLI